MSALCPNNRAGGTAPLTAVLRILMHSFIFLAAALSFTSGQAELMEQILQETRPVLGTDRFYRIGVPADAAGTDTRFDVKAAQRPTPASMSRLPRGSRFEPREGSLYSREIPEATAGLTAWDFPQSSSPFQTQTSAPSSERSYS